MGWHRRRRSGGQNYTWSTATLGFSCVAAPVLLGGVPVHVALALFVLVALSALLILPDQWRQKAPAPSLPLWGVALALVSAIRLIPGTGGLFGLGTSASGTFEHPEVAHILSGHGSLHFAPGAGYREVLHLLTLALAMGLSFVLCRRDPRAKRTLLTWIAVGGLLVLFLGYLGLVFKKDLVFSVYQSREVIRQTPFFSSLLNTNHLGGYLVFLTGIFFGLALLETRPRVRFFFQLAGLTSIGGCVLTFSRGSLSALVLFLIFLGPWFIFNNPRPRDTAWQRPTRKALTLLGLGFAAAMIAWALAGPWISTTRSGGENVLVAAEAKMRIWEAAVAVIESAPWFGVGPGGFPDAVAPFQGSDPGVVFTHVENLPLQVLVDHGLIVGGVVLVVGFIFLWRLFWWSTRDLAHLCFIAGVIALLVQNGTDFNLMYAGTGIPLAVLVGAMGSDNPIFEARRVRGGLWLAVAVVLGGLVALPSFRWDRVRTQDRIAQQVKRGGDLDSIREAVRMYPNSGDFITAAALAVEREKDLPTSLKIHDVARLRAPYSFFSALMSARAYQRLGKAELAARSYEAACSMDETAPGLRERWISSILIHAHGRAVFEDLTKRAPDCVDRVLWYAHSKQRYDTVYQLASLAIGIAPDDVRILYWRGRMAFHRGHWAQASMDTAMLLGMHSERAEGYLLEGLLLRKRDPASAVHLFEEAVQKDLRWGEPTLLWAETAIDLKDRDGLRRALGAIRLHDGFSGRSMYVAKSLQGRFALRMEEYEQAVQAFQSISGYVLARPLLRKCYLESLVGWRRFQAARVLCKSSWPPQITAQVQEICRSLPPEGTD